MPVLWLPGEWPTTNQALSSSRADGWYHGYKKRAGLNPRTGPAYSYAQYAQDRAEAAAFHAMVLRRKWAPVGEVGLWFWLFGRTARADAADSWAIAAKWATDGMVAAKLLQDDRRAVRWSGGRSVKSASEGRAVSERLGWVWSGWRPGLAVEIVELADDAVHCPPWAQPKARPCEP